MLTKLTPSHIIQIKALFQQTLPVMAQQLPPAQLRQRIIKHKLDKQLPPDLQDLLQQHSLSVEQALSLREGIVAAALNLLNTIDATQPLHENLRQLNRVGQVFMLRANYIERHQIEEDKAMRAITPQVNQAMRQLGFSNTLSSSTQHKEYDIALILGGYQARITDRSQYFAELLNQGYRFKRIAYLAGDRTLVPGKDPALQILKQAAGGTTQNADGEAFNEFDMAKIVHQSLVNSKHYPASFAAFRFETKTTMNTKETLARINQPLTTFPRVRPSYVETFGAPQQNMKLDFVNGASIYGSKKRLRPTTASTIEDYLAFLIQSGLYSPQQTKSLKVCTISIQPHATQQAIVAKTLLPDTIEVIPFGKACKQATASDYLDNLARTIYQYLQYLKTKPTLTARVRSKLK